MRKKTKTKKNAKSKDSNTKKRSSKKGNGQTHLSSSPPIAAHPPLEQPSKKDGDDGGERAPSDDDTASPQATSPRKTAVSNESKENTKEKDIKEYRQHHRVHSKDKDNNLFVSKPKEAKEQENENLTTSLATTNSSSSVTASTNTNVSPTQLSETLLNDAEKKARAEKRAALIRELLVSEQKHVEELKSIVVDYMMPLQKILTKTQYKQLFCNIELIMGWNMQFLTCLKPRIESGDGTFGDILIEMSLALRQIYSQYSENYISAQATYQECMKNIEFQNFIQHQVKTKSSNLLTALNLPMHRMIMYDSLLKDIISLTPKDHPDYEDLCNALKLIRSVNAQAARVVEKRKNMNQVLEIQNTLNGMDIAEPHRKFVFEGEVNLLLGPKTLKPRKLFLFNDILLITKLKRKKYEVLHKLNLKQITVQDVEEDRRTFIIRSQTDGEFVFVSEDDKQTWVQMINMTIKQLNSIPVELTALKVEEQEHDAETEKLKQQIANDISKDELIDTIIAWSEMKTEDVMKELKILAEKLQNWRRLHNNLKK